jgi:hypothetical protein
MVTIGLLQGSGRAAIRFSRECFDALQQLHDWSSYQTINNSLFYK